MNPADHESRRGCQLAAAMTGSSPSLPKHSAITPLNSRSRHQSMKALHLGGLNFDVRQMRAASALLNRSTDSALLVGPEAITQDAPEYFSGPGLRQLSL